MDHGNPQHTEPELDALLRRNRPEPDPAWVRTTGERLLPARRRRLPALRLAGALAGGLAAVTVGLSLAGVGPIADDRDVVEARDECRPVTVERVQRLPSIATVDGELRLQFRRETVRRTVERCD